MKKTIALDFGSAYIRVGMPNGEVITVESVAATEIKSGNPVAFGDEARHLAERTPGGVDLVRPFTDMKKLLPDMTVGMLEALAAQIGRKHGFRADLAVSLPGQPGEAAEEFFSDKAGDAGACEVVVVPPTCAAANAIDAGKLSDLLIVHLGASCTEISYVSSGSETSSGWVNVGGRAFDDAIGDYVYRKYSILLDEDTCEKIKNRLATLKKPEEIPADAIGGDVIPRAEKPEKTMTVTGVKRKTGLPKSVTLKEGELCPTLEAAFAPIAEEIRKVLKQEKNLPDKVVLTGGFSAMNGIREAIGSLTGVLTETRPDPELAVVTGLMNMIDNEVI